MAAQPAKSILVEDLMRDAQPRTDGANSSATHRAWCSTPPAAPASRRARCTAMATCRGRWRAWRARCTSCSRTIACSRCRACSSPTGWATASPSRSAAAPRPSCAASGRRRRSSPMFAKYRPTVFFAVPTVFRMLLEYVRQGNKLDTSSLTFASRRAKCCRSRPGTNGRPSPASRSSRPSAPPSCCTRSSTTTAIATGPAAPAWCSTATNASSRDEHGNAIAGRRAADTCSCSGGSAIPYYLNKPEKTAEPIRDGWVRTGDIYRRDEDGFFWFEGRSDDLFKCSGMWVSPGEVEDAVVHASGGARGRGGRRGRRQGRHHSPRPMCCCAPETSRMRNWRRRSWRKQPKACRASSARAHPLHGRSCRAPPTGKVQRFKLRQLARSRRGILEDLLKPRARPPRSVVLGPRRLPAQGPFLRLKRGSVRYSFCCPRE